ncbi:MAG: glycosyltransferase family A protein [Chitinophagaceae bacterium]
MSEIKITVLMPAFNAGRYIGEAIRSVLAQDHPSFELLIINDGSTDNTAEVINHFNDPRIKLISQPNQGISIALNNGLKGAKGKYIARFDADDICLPGRLKVQAAFLDANPDYFICGSDAAYITEEGQHLFDFYCNGYSHGDIIKDLFTRCPLIHSAAMYRKEMVLQAGGYPLYAHSFEDHLLWVQLKDAGKFHNINEQLVKIRFSASSFTIDEKWRGPAFRNLKQKILRRGAATAEDGEQLLAIIRQQEKTGIKQGAYYSLCGKKLLVNNHRPAAARKYLKKAIRLRPLRPDTYFFYGLSFFPKGFIKRLHEMTAQKNNR